MLFSSLSFIFFFLPISLAGYYLLRGRTARNVFLFLVSLIFYAWGEPWFVLVMLLSILLNWCAGLWVAFLKERGRKLWPAILATCVVNLGLLFIYKYLNFVVDNIGALLHLQWQVPRFTLPIGISFFTFQAMSYVLDVARDQGEVQRNPLNVGLYVAFFPQLIAGPIVRYQTVAREINERQENWADFTSGMERFLIGMAKKVLLANTLAVIADRTFAQNPLWHSASYAWLGVLAYSLQIFYDFSGYSDMAIGMGRMFGFHFDENFDLPYMSTSISEFWRRWHISLGTWFRDYVYFPLGGSRVESRRRLVFNLTVVWFLTGLWHGADWTFILWGLYFLIFLVFEKLCGMDTRNQSGLHLLRRLYTILVVMIGWVLFRADNLPHAWAYLRAMVGLNEMPFFDDITRYYLLENGVILVAALLFCTPVEKLLGSWAERRQHMAAVIQPLCLVGLFLIAVSCVVKNTYNPFIYFNF